MTKLDYNALMINEILHGDAKELSRGIPNNSVSLLFTDPPYDRDSLHLYRWLSHIGAKVLKPGKTMWVYGGYMDSRYYDHLGGNPVMTEVETHVLWNAGPQPRWWSKKQMVGWKPIFVYSKGDVEELPWRSTFHKSEQDKRFHSWGQGMSLTLKIIEMLTDPGDIVFDPFCGGGQTAAACKFTGRNFITFDISEKAVLKSQQRLAEMPVPMPTILFERQLGLEVKDER